MEDSAADIVYLLVKDLDARNLRDSIAFWQGVEYLKQVKHPKRWLISIFNEHVEGETIRED